MPEPGLKPEEDASRSRRLKALRFHKVAKAERFHTGGVLNFPMIKFLLRKSVRGDPLRHIKSF